MLRAYAGLSADDAASREDKDKLGQLAYVQAALKFLREVPESYYKVTIDGEEIYGEALIVFILNAGSIGGVMGISLPTIGDVDISDGYLDLYAITKDIESLYEQFPSIFSVTRKQISRCLSLAGQRDYARSQPQTGCLDRWRIGWSKPLSRSPPCPRHWKLWFRPKIK